MSNDAQRFAQRSIAHLDGAVAAWLPIRRAQLHPTLGQVIAVRAEVDGGALPCVS